MRILVLAPQPFWSPRGTPIAVGLLVEALVAEGHAVEVLTYHEGLDRVPPGVRLHRIPAPPGVQDVPPSFSWKKLVCDVFLAMHAYRLVRDGRFELVHAVEEAAFVALALKRLLGVPFVYDMDASLAGAMLDRFPALRPARRWLESAEAAAVRGSAGVLAVCEALAARARAAAPEVIVRRLEDPSLLDDRTAPDELEHLRSRGEPIVLYVGNLEPYQGVDLLVEGFARASSRLGKARLVVIGGTPEHIEGQRQRAAALGIASQASFLGPRPIERLGSYLEQATVLVSPRLRGENTAMKVYSYMDSGRPILATRLPTHTQVLDDDTALLVEPDPEALAAGLVRLVSDRRLGERLGRRARERVRRDHGREAYRRKLHEFYGLVQAHAAPAGPG